MKSTRKYNKYTLLSPSLAYGYYGFGLSSFPERAIPAKWRGRRKWLGRRRRRREQGKRGREEQCSAIRTSSVSSSSSDDEEEEADVVAQSKHGTSNKTAAGEKRKISQRRRHNFFLPWLHGPLSSLLLPFLIHKGPSPPISILGCLKSLLCHG